MRISSIFRTATVAASLVAATGAMSTAFAESGVQQKSPSSQTYQLQSAQAYHEELVNLRLSPDDQNR